MIITGILGSIYATWLLFAAGIDLLLLSTILFSFGIPVYWWARHDHAPNEPFLSRHERTAAITLVILSAGAGVLIVTGTLH